MYTNTVAKVSATQSIIGYVCQTKKILLLRTRDEVYNHPYFNKDVDEQYYKDEERKSLLIVPIFSDTTGNVIGALKFVNFKTETDDPNE